MFADHRSVRGRGRLLLRACAGAIRTCTGCAALPCSAGADEDADGLSDDCELAFATTFAPVLRTAEGGCNWDAQNERLGGGYYLAVMPVDAQTVGLLYLPAYYRDCGWTGFKCTLHSASCAPHSGDSELIAIELSVPDPARPTVRGLLRSAHCFGSDANCQLVPRSGAASFRVARACACRLGSRRASRRTTRAQPPAMRVTGSTTRAMAPRRRIAFQSCGHGQNIGQWRETGERPRGA